MRDTGDGTAFKVDGVRGNTYVGQAGETRGSKALKDEDGAVARSALDAYRAEVEQGETAADAGFVGIVVPTAQGTSSGSSGSGGSAASIPPVAPTPPAVVASTEAEKAASTARDALTFFFSDEGAIFRTFLLDEVVNAADALSRSALAQVVASPVGRAVGALPTPEPIRKLNHALFSSLAPPLTPKDEQVVRSLQKLLAFFAGDLDLEQSSSAGSTSLGGGGGAALDAEALQKARALLPVLQENRVEMQRFGAQIVLRLTELQAARAFGLAREQILPKERKDEVVAR